MRFQICGGVTATLILICGLVLLPGLTTAISKKNLAEDAKIAKENARIELLRQIGKGARSTLGPLDLSQHSYVKLTELTEKIGFASNENLLAYQTLLSQGYTRPQALQILYTQRPEICSPQLASCNPFDPYRRINGTCNNINQPLWGSILTPFKRLVPQTYSDGYNEQKGGKSSSRLPNVRLVSTMIHNDLVKPDFSITNLVPQIGQLLDHDISLTPEGDKPCCTTATAEIDCWSIQVYANDSFYSHISRPQTCLDFTRSTPYCFPTASGVREQTNILTAYIDANFVYGSDAEREFQLRSFSRGQLRVNGANPKLLPSVREVEEAIGHSIPFKGEFLAGDERVNETPVLAVMHTLFLREHNRIAAGIYQRQPTWSDELIFQEARRLLIAEWQNIVFSEYLPVILGGTTMQRYELNLPSNPASYTSYQSNLDATIFTEFATAAYRFGHTLVNGLVRLMHGLTVVGSYNLRDNFFVADQITQGNGMGYDLILGGLMTQNAQSYDEHVTEDLTNHVLRNPANDFGSDLMARNLHRGRDHGIPGYDEYRKICGLSGLTTWSNRPPQIRPEVWSKFQSLYDTPQDIDLFSAGIAEYPVTDGVSGTVFNCIKALQFSRLFLGDRYFFTHNAQPKPFTSAQLQIIRGRRLGDIICENSAIESAQLNVFRANTGPSGTNPRIRCDDASRVQLNLAEFV